MNAGDLGGPLLASVSRSFYLTIRILPARLQQPIGLAYLLARTSDTIADTARAPESVRLKHLDALETMIRNGTSDRVADLQNEISPPDPDEQRLIANLSRCLEAHRNLAEFDRQQIVQVLGEIIRGQSLDLQRFQSQGKIVALANASELEEYTYLVAGSVGGFWTRLCFHHLPRYSPKNPEHLTELGVRYGKGLQLVNILRDLPADMKSGRCYLPADELQQAGSSGESPSRVVFERWRTRAERYLEDGRQYIAALRPMRLRMGCYLPWYLGIKTLRLLEKTFPLDSTEKIKVPRSTVRSALFRAPFIGLSNAALSWS